MWSPESILSQWWVQYHDSLWCHLVDYIVLPGGCLGQKSVMGSSVSLSASHDCSTVEWSLSNLCWSLGDRCNGEPKGAFHCQCQWCLPPPGGEISHSRHWSFLATDHLRASQFSDYGYSFLLGHFHDQSLWKCSSSGRQHCFPHLCLSGPSRVHHRIHGSDETW